MKQLFTCGKFFSVAFVLAFLSLNHRLHTVYVQSVTEQQLVNMNSNPCLKNILLLWKEPCLRHSSQLTSQLIWTLPTLRRKLFFNTIPVLKYFKARMDISTLSRHSSVFDHITARYSLKPNKKHEIKTLLCTILSNISWRSAHPIMHSF